MDHPGIVHQVANFFSSQNINIHNLDTFTERAPHTGTPIFSLGMEVEVPPEIRIVELRDDFFYFCDGQRSGRRVQAILTQVPSVSNITPVEHRISRRERESRSRHRGGVLWLTGLSGAGKSTLAFALEEQLFRQGWQVYVLDGDNVRHGS